MNDQCHDCKIRKLCYLEEPEEDWTCDHYKPCEYDEEVATDINVGDKDTISRKAAIDALHTCFSDGFDGDKWWNSTHVLSAIEGLPPAQPEIIRCKDCKYWVPGYITDNDDFIPPKCGEWQQMVGHSSDDYCSLAERREVTE